MNFFKTKPNMLQQDFHRGNNPAYNRVAFVAEHYDELVAMYKDILERIRDLNIRFSDKFNIHTITEDIYTLEDSDFDGNTLVRCTSENSAVNITIPLPPSENFIGSGITIRKSNGNQNTLLNLLPSDGVTITPLDITPLRRIGSTVVLVYVGNGMYEAFGELP